MSWVLQDEADREIIREIGEQSDRGAIIIAGSFLETRLLQAIQMRLDPDATPDQLGKMFKGTNPLATFSAKIDLGALLQIYPTEFKELLHKIRDLRNDAAHETKPISFQTQSIAAKCRNLDGLAREAFIAGTTFGARYGAFVVHRKFQVVRQLMTAIADAGSESGTRISFGFGDDLSPKEMFMTAIKVGLYHLQAMKPYLSAVQLVLPPSPDKPG